MSRPAQVIINLAALRHNFSRVRTLAPSSRIIAVVKADAYGHGLVRIAQALPDADAFGVACLEEAVELRKADITAPIVLLEGPYTLSELDDIDRLDLDIVVHQMEQVDMLEHYRGTGRIRVWLKMDSGMHRLGLEPDHVRQAWSRLKSCTVVNPEIRLMTHMANAGNPESPMTRTQLAVFNQACAGLAAPRTIANSASLLAWPETRTEYVRPGLILYGVSPMDTGTAADHGLLPVMTLQSSLISVRQVAKGETVGYGAEWICPENMPIGIVAVGYGDGFPRHGRNGTPVLINGVRCQIIGNPSMDMLTVDLRNVPSAGVGDPVILWGNGGPAIEEVARSAKTIAYELLCAVHKRVKVVVDEQGKDPVSV